MKKSILFLIPLFPVFVICQTGNKKAEIVHVFPSDTIPMQYSPGYPNFNMPILDGIVNDSLHLKVFFDTGTSGNRFFISDSLKNLFVRDSACVQIGKFKKRMGIKYLGSSQGSLIDLFGKNTILVGWKFFENKIIEFNFKNQHIFVYEELPDVTEYSKTKITLHHPQNTPLLIPVQVVLQGKTIEDTVIIDTGHNGYIDFNIKQVEKQGIDKIDAFYGKSTVSGGSLPGFSIPADTIKIGTLYVANQNIRISFSNHPGLLGTKTMENFSVILDLINFDLYLKKIDN